MSKEPQVELGYADLDGVLNDAFTQASQGKGRERHGNGLPFAHQPMQVISELLGGTTGMAFQACKKIVEAQKMPDYAARRRELLGAIVYVAGMVVYEDNHKGFD